MFILRLIVGISKNNAAKIIGFATLPPKQLIIHVIDDIFKIDVAKTNRLSNSIMGTVVKPMVLATQFATML